MRQLHRACRGVALPDRLRPFEALRVHRDDPYVCLLENPGEPSRLGRYSFLCLDPFLVFRSKRSECFAGRPGDVRKLTGAPFNELAALLERYGMALPQRDPGWPPFLGGAVGYLGYELLYELERVGDTGRDERPVPDAYLLFCHTVVARDEVEGRTWLIANDFAPSPELAGERADARLQAELRRLSLLGEAPWSDAFEAPFRSHRRARERLTGDQLAASGVRPVLDRAAYLQMVERAREHILAGDVFEVCITHRFDTSFEGEGIDLYRALRTVNPAPFAAYLRFPEVEVLSSSPERFLRLDRDRWAEMRPIKGTRPRGSDEARDRALAAELASSEKDLAENIMIVDLARNDLGRVCELGTVRVPELQIVETHPFTHQLVSTVRGRLRAEVGPLELVRAAFPGGSMTGAPKIEAMRIIDQLEPVKRGIYSGALGYFDFEGGVDLSILIRTFIKKGARLDFHVGGAVVADSVPEDEYQETLDKAHGLVVALDLARQGGRQP